MRIVPSIDVVRGGPWAPLRLAAVGVAVFCLAPPRAGAELRGAAPSPTASEFARVVVGTTTAYALAHGAAIRLRQVHCVKASRVDYMCSYAVARPGRAPECHLMQATWTPARASIYTVTLAGRVRACGTLREAIRSLP